MASPPRSARVFTKSLRIQQGVSNFSIDISVSIWILAISLNQSLPVLSMRGVESAT